MRTGQNKQPIRHLGPSKLGEYNGSIDILKMVFTSIIVLFHANEKVDYYRLFPSGVMAFEFFFVVSGYYLATHIKSLPKLQEENLGKETLDYAIKRIKRILPCYLFTFAFAMIVFLFDLLKQHPSKTDLVETIGKTSLNFLLLSSTGIAEESVLSLTWIISATLIACMILYPLLRKYNQMFLTVIAPISMILLLGYFSSTYSGIYMDNEWKTVLPSLVLRAILGISAGCFAFLLSEKLKEIDFTIIGRKVLSALEILLYTAAVLSMIYLNRDIIFVMILLFVAAIAITTSKQGYISRVCDRQWVKPLRKYSLAVFLSHITVRKFMLNEEIQFDKSIELAIMLVATVIISALCVLVCKLCSNIYNSKKDEIIKIFINK